MIVAISKKTHSVRRPLQLFRRGNPTCPNRQSNYSQNNMTKIHTQCQTPTIRSARGRNQGLLLFSMPSKMSEGCTTPSNNVSFHASRRTPVKTFSTQASNNYTSHSSTFFGHRKFIIGAPKNQGSPLRSKVTRVGPSKPLTLTNAPTIQSLVQIGKHQMMSFSVSSSPPDSSSKRMTRSEKLSLYRQILKSHRGFAVEYQAIGTTFVRDEWKRHMNAGPEYADAFLDGWKGYLEQIYKTQRHMQEAQVGAMFDQLQEDEGMSPPLTGDSPHFSMDKFSPDQLAQLGKFREELDMLGSEDDDDFRKK